MAMYSVYIKYSYIHCKGAFDLKTATFVLIKEKAIVWEDDVHAGILCQAAASIKACAVCVCVCGDVYQLCEMNKTCKSRRQPQLTSV